MSFWPISYAKTAAAGSVITRRTLNPAPAAAELENNHNMTDVITIVFVFSKMGLPPHFYSVAQAYKKESFFDFAED